MLLKKQFYCYLLSAKMMLGTFYKRKSKIEIGTRGTHDIRKCGDW